MYKLVLSGITILGVVSGGICYAFCSPRSGVADKAVVTEPKTSPAPAIPSVEPEYKLASGSDVAALKNELQKLKDSDVGTWISELRNANTTLNKLNHQIDSTVSECKNSNVDSAKSNLSSYIQSLISALESYKTKISGFINGLEKSDLQEKDYKEIKKSYEDSKNEVDGYKKEVEELKKFEKEYVDSNMEKIVKQGDYCAWLSTLKMNNRLGTQAG